MSASGSVHFSAGKITHIFTGEKVTVHGVQKGLDMIAQKIIPQADTKLTEPLLVGSLVIRGMTPCIYLLPMIAVFVHVWDTS
jgi:hypothetical protein